MHNLTPQADRAAPTRMPPTTLATAPTPTPSPMPPAPAPAPALRLALHAYPALQIAGRPCAMRLRHALALLAYLAESGRPVGRDLLVALLWPDVDPARGRARLRRLAYELQAAAGAALLVGDAETLALAPGWTSDLQATRRAMQAAAAGDPAAVGALLGPQAAQLLHGFVLGAEGFDDWLGRARRAHEQALADALARAAEHALARGDDGLAEAAAQALLAIEPCSEAGHAACMAARALRRDAAGVEVAYFECAERLRAEFGQRPSPRLEAAYVAAFGQARSDALRLAIRFAPTTAGEVAYAAWGRGPSTLVVLWGALSNLEVALEEPRARRLLDALARDHRVVLLDRRGTGLSERVDVRPDAASAAEDIEAVLDQLGAGRAWLFGSSVGGTLALDFACRRPARCAGLLLYGTSVAGGWTPDTPWALRDDGAVAWLRRFTEPAHYDDGLRRLAPSAADDPWVRDWYARLLRAAGSKRGTAQLLQAYRGLDLRGRLAALRLPALVLQRRGDRVVPLAAGRRLAAELPGADIELLDGDDHLLWHGDSAAVLGAVQRFLARHGGAATDGGRTPAADAHGQAASGPVQRV
jgi:pimeloyl-ACP methyl ester carboxylesterase/DNA-binding SARP family transcriptional activator